MKLILASSSPRRKELLTQQGFEFKIVKPDIPEVVKRGEDPREFVKRLSFDKALAVLQMIEPDERAVIIAADTTVVSPRGKILNKPESEKEAEQMLSSLQGKTHIVYTAYTILAETKNGKIQAHTRAIATRVTMRALKKEEIRAYIATGEPMDKAGAYGAQSIGMGLIEKIQGSYTNVVGLPVAELLRDLDKKFAVRPTNWKR